MKEGIDMKKLFFVYNPHSGKGLVKSEVPKIIDVFVKEGYLPTVYPTQSYKDAYRVVSKLDDTYDLIVCSGGDGTLDEVVTAMVKHKITCPLGYIPAGSTNDFAKSMKLSRDMVEAAYVAAAGREFPCDVGSFNDGIFVYVAAFGMFTDVSYATPQDIKNVLGHMAYVLEGIKRIYNIPSYHMRITCDDQEPIIGNYMFGMISNSKSIGGYKSVMGKNTLFDDGKFEVMLIRRPDNLIELQEVAAALLIEQFDSKYMQTYDVSKIRIECAEEIAWTLDGEFGGEHHTVEIENMHKAMKIMIAKDEEMKSSFVVNKWAEEMMES